MKNILLIFCVAIFAISCSPEQLDSSGKIKITHVKTYSKCEACKLYLESSLPGKKGIVFAELDLDKETLMIKYDQTLVSLQQVKQHIVDRGFWADELEPDEELEEQLPSCCVKPDETR